uniref:Uncharacterized protein n=1 Tax=Arundo donax TaxID=35708 RepID=A0A0A8Z711_ARUDO
MAAAIDGPMWMGGCVVLIWSVICAGERLGDFWALPTWHEN